MTGHQRDKTRYTKKCSVCGALTRAITNNYHRCGKCYLEWKRKERREENEKR